MIQVTVAAVVVPTKAQIQSVFPTNQAAGMKAVKAKGSPKEMIFRTAGWKISSGYFAKSLKVYIKKTMDWLNFNQNAKEAKINFKAVYITIPITTMKAKEAIEPMVQVRAKAVEA